MSLTQATCACAEKQGIRFYDLILLDLVGEPYHILKYDQFVDFYCYVVITILMMHVRSSRRIISGQR